MDRHRARAVCLTRLRLPSNVIDTADRNGTRKNYGMNPYITHISDALIAMPLYQFRNTFNPYVTVPLAQSGKASL